MDDQVAGRGLQPIDRPGPDLPVARLTIFRIFTETFSYLGH
jgi:hypothetical protein